MTTDKQDCKIACQQNLAVKNQDWKNNNIVYHKTDFNKKNF